MKATNERQASFPFRRYGTGEGVCLLLSDSAGAYIPRDFCEAEFPSCAEDEDEYDPVAAAVQMRTWGLIPKHTSEPDNAGDCIHAFSQWLGTIRCLLKGPTPENEWYWDDWNTLLDTARRRDSDGDVWVLHQDGDLWALCHRRMTNEEWNSFYEEDKPDWVYESDGCTVYWVCVDCYECHEGLDSEMECETPKRHAEVAWSLDRLAQKHKWLSADGGEDEFSWNACDCCGSSLGGARYRLIGTAEPGKSEEE